MKKKVPSNFKINFEKIEEIYKLSGLNSEKAFAEACGVEYPTYLAVKNTKRSGGKFINGLIAYCKEELKIDLKKEQFVY